MKRKKDLVFICLYGSYFGGMERRYTRLASYLSKIPNLRITLITFSDALSVLSELGIDTHHMKIKIADSSILLKWILKIKRIKRFHGTFLRMRLMIYLLIKRPDRVVFCHNPDTLFYTFMLYRKEIYDHFFSLAVPVSVVAVGSSSVDNTLTDYSKNAMSILDKLHSVDALSPVIGKHLKSHNENANIKIAPCSFTDYSKIQRSNRRDIDILMVARFTELKGYDLLEEIAEIAEKYKLVICGFGDLTPQIPHAVITSLTNPLPLYSRAKVFLSIQQTNNYPSQSLLEAMASGCAIIATDVGETRMILDESNSILIRYDALELKDAIEQLMDQPELIQQLGENARKKAINEHTIERYADYFCNDVLGLHD